MQTSYRVAAIIIACNMKRKRTLIYAILSILSGTTVCLPVGQQSQEHLFLVTTMVVVYSLTSTVYATPIGEPYPG